MKATLLVSTLALITLLAARESLASRISQADPAKYRHNSSVHGGPGALNYMTLAPTVFLGPWAYVDHLQLPPGA